MNEKEKRFINELEIFRSEAQMGAQFLYGYLSFNIIINKKERVRTAVNLTPFFWNTTMGAFQTSFFITLGRIFDQKSPHNIDRLLRAAQDNLEIFSKDSLEVRKRATSDNAAEWIDDYLKSVYIPTIQDIRKLRRKVKEYRVIYQKNYSDIRHKIYAHKEITDSEEIQNLFSKTNIKELQKVFVFVNALYEALWELFYNGKKPTLKGTRYSVNSIRKARKPMWQSQSVQERMVGEVEDVLKNLTSNIKNHKLDTSSRRAD